MKKFLKTAIFGASVSAMAFSSAIAGEIRLNADQTNLTFSDDGALTIAGEAATYLQGRTYKLDPTVISFRQQVGRTILYRPGIAFNDNDRVTFRLTNATFNDSNYYLIACEKLQSTYKTSTGSYISAAFSLNKDGDTLDCFELGNTVSGGQGQNYVTIRIANSSGKNLGDKTVYILTSSNSRVGDGSSTNSTAYSYNTTYNPIIKFDNTINSNSAVTISVNVTDSAGKSLPLAEVPPTNLIQFKNQFNVSFIKGTSTIDVTGQSYRTKFAEEGNDDDILTTTNDTDLTASSGVIKVDNDSNNEVEDYLNLDDVSKLEVKLGDTTTNLDGWDFANNNVYIDWGNPATGDTTDNTNINFDSTTLIADIPSTKLPDHGASAQDDVYIGVDGNTILNPQSIPITAKLKFNGNDFPDETFQESQFILWDINGAQFKVSYLYNSSNTWVRIANDGPISGDISVDLYDEQGNEVKDVKLGSIAPYSAKVIYAPSIVSAAISQKSWPVDQNKGFRFTAKFTVTAPANAISATAVQRIPGGVDRVIPVLYKETQTICSGKVKPVKVNLGDDDNPKNIYTISEDSNLNCKTEIQWRE